MQPLVASTAQTQITYRDRKTNIWGKITDVNESARTRKWTWAGHASRIRENRWTSRITTWKPYEGKGSLQEDGRDFGEPDRPTEHRKSIRWQRKTDISGNNMPNHGTLREHNDDDEDYDSDDADADGDDDDLRHLRIWNKTRTGICHTKIV